MKISGQPVASSDQYERQQPIRLKRGLYGGLLKSYSAPKMYPKFNSAETEEKFYVRFLVTHDAGGRQLPKFSEAYCGMRTKLFYDESKDLASTMVRMYSALLAGKASVEEIASGEYELPDLDDLIGFPAMLYIKPAASPDKDGITANMIDTQAGGFAAPDKAFRQAAYEIYKIADMAYSEKSGLQFLKKPETQFEESAATVPASDDRSYSSSDIDEGEIPF